MYHNFNESGDKNLCIFKKNKTKKYISQRLMHEATVNK